jgi:hypothetical protein
MHHTFPLIALDFWLCVKENQLFMTNLVQYVTGSSNTLVLGNGMVKIRRRIRQKIRLPVFFDPKIKSQPGFCLIEAILL